MNRSILYKVLLIIGTLPFLVPIVWGLVSVTKNVGLIDFLILYSFLYWPTYLLGIALIATASVLMIIKRK